MCCLLSSGISQLAMFDYQRVNPTNEPYGFETHQMMGSPDSAQLSVSETGFFFADETVAIFDHGEASMEWLLGIVQIIWIIRPWL